MENFNSEIKNWSFSNNSFNVVFIQDLNPLNNNLDYYLSSDGVHLNKLGQNLDSIYNTIY